jgi:hypothetical protein
MGNLLPILISYNLHKEYLKCQSDHPPRKEEVMLLKEQEMFLKNQVSEGYFPT